ncbi:SDR family oxidoreductase [Aspergillus undulatus]|uniref:SDR family oxidoreductase n=1 Tax=Aspergillus undulatus TaxID=1810928 RepID=UPI003CCCF808
MPRIWFITGCSSGFGRELAITAAQNNDTVVATSRDLTKLADLTSLGIIPKALDIRASDAEVKAVIDDVEATIGPIDILVNNAGYLLEGAVEECTNDEILDQFDTNVFSQIRVLRAALPAMRARKSGVVANIGSIGGWFGGPATGLYCASKAAVAVYTESLRHELASLGIEVTCIEPGYFRTNFLVGGHKVVAKNRIEDLHLGTKGYREALKAYNLHQPGDPAKGAQVIVEALTKSGRCEGRSLPPRLALGLDAIIAIGGSLEREREMLDSWGEVIGSTDCDDVEA